MNTLKTFLIEENIRASTKRIVDKLNSATNNKHNIGITTRTGSSEAMISIKTKDGKIPGDIISAFKMVNVGVGDKETIKNEDGSTTLKISVMQLS